KQRIDSRTIPGNVAGLGFQPVSRAELAIGQGHIKRVLFGREACRPIVIPVPGMVDAAETGEPILVPIALVIGDVVVFGVGWLAHPKHRGHGRLEVVDRHGDGPGDSRWKQSETSGTSGNSQEPAPRQAKFYHGAAPSLATRDYSPILTII